MRGTQWWQVAGAAAGAHTRAAAVRVRKEGSRSVSALMLQHGAQEVGTSRPHGLLVAAANARKQCIIWFARLPPSARPTGGFGGEMTSRKMSSDAVIPYIDPRFIKVKFARSSGPGGQHVNKTESKVDMRIDLNQLELPPEVHERLFALQAGRINKDNELVVTADGNRNRQRNYDECVEKLCEIMKEAATMPKDWNKSSKTKEKFNAVRLTEKKLHSNKKKQRNDRIDY